MPVDPHSRSEVKQWLFAALASVEAAKPALVFLQILR